MEPNDEIVERQKLVPNDGETEEEVTNSQQTTAPQSAPKSAPTPASPVASVGVPKINQIKGPSSGDSRNSASCSIDNRTMSEKGAPATSTGTAKVSYVNERRPRPQLHVNSASGEDRFEFKSRPRKLLKDDVEPDVVSEHNLNSITCLDGLSDININNNNNNNEQNNNKNTISSTGNVVGEGISEDDVENYNNNSTSNKKPHERHDLTPMNQLRQQQQQQPVYSSCAPMTLLANINNNVSHDERPIKHHSFVSEVPDVKHMERALLGLLDDFHSGKLKAFGGSNTMDQMTKIREQQESLAKLHFELAAAEEDALERGNDFNTAKAQENMLQLVQRLEQLSISIEQLQSSHTSL